MPGNISKVKKVTRLVRKDKRTFESIVICSTVRRSLLIRHPDEILPEYNTNSLCTSTLKNKCS